MEAYIKGPILGRGTFGEVIKATHKEVRGAGADGASSRRSTEQTGCGHATDYSAICWPSCRPARWWPSRRSVWERRVRYVACPCRLGWTVPPPGLTLAAASAAT